MANDTALMRMVIRQITKRYGWTNEVAMERFYNSEICNKLSDRRTGLFTCAPIEIVDLFAEECRILKAKLPFEISDLTPLVSLAPVPELPDVLTKLDGTKVTTAAEWEERDEEIRRILQYYMYGVWRGGEGEILDYTVSGNNIGITVKREGLEGAAEFTSSVSLPQGNAPAGGWPVIVGIGGVGQTAYANSRGYAAVSFTPTVIAADNFSRTGEFYNIYPYGSTWEQQTGSLMAWAWGAGKILDALEAGAGSELKISTEITMVTGVSRYGKAAAVAGAFEERFLVTMPVCSGYGGLTIGRYTSNNKTYNLGTDFLASPKANSVGNHSAWLSFGGTEPIGSLHGNGGWFNTNFQSIPSYEHCPYDQHFLAALAASKGRYLYMVTGINSDMWNSPPGMQYCHDSVLPVFELLGTRDNLAINMHINLHGIEIEDLIKLFAWFEYKHFGKEPDTSSYPADLQAFLANFTPGDLKTTVFKSEANREVYNEGKPAN
ncbi:MAG: hypothetical protein LBS21_14700 [Clostridiales bacterium]|jgi:hypothetical protein|nr:hypothetical protein [Clostridiales bacterium]